MIEVLVALLVLGAGALAMTMLQLQALRHANENALRMTAAALAAELAELRAAHRAVTPSAADPYLFTVSATQPVPSASACDTTCDPDGFARTAVVDWSARLLRELPGARAVICRDGNTSRSPGWTCDDNASAPVIAKLGWSNAGPGGTPAISLPIGR